MRLYQRIFPYGVAIGSTAIALLLKLWLEPLVSETLGSFFYIAILISSWYGGFRPGFVTVILSTLAINYIFIPPRYQFWISQPKDILQLGIFLLLGLLINLLTSNFLKSKQKIQQLNQKLAQENAEQLRMALSAAQMGMWDWNIVTGEIIWSPEHEQLFGLIPGTFDGKYETFDARLHPDDRPGLNQAVQEALQTHSIYQHEYRIIWADGSIHWVEGRGQVFYDAADQPVRMTGTIIAIDERKQAEQTLAKEALRIRTLFNTSFDGIVILDGQGNVLDANPRFAQMLGYTPEETARLNIFDWDAQFTPEELRQLMRDYINFKSGVLETRHRRKDGSIYDVEISVSVVEWEGEILRFCVCRDISDRKQAELALQEREATLRLFVQYAPAGIAMFDRDMCYLMASQRWVDDYDLDSIASLIGRSHYEIFPEISERWRQIHQRCLAGASEKCDEDLFVRTDGSQQWIRWEIHPWHTAIGEIGGIIIFGDDITQRKQVQIALQQLNTELEERVAQRTAQLAQANDRLLETVAEQQHTQLMLLEQAQLLDLAHDTIMTRELNGVISFWNKGAELMYGWKKAEALGQVAHILLQTQFPQPLTEFEAELLEKGYWEGELIHVNRDNQPITVASRWVLQKDHIGRPIKVLEINNDITSHKQAEAALQQYVLEVEDLYNNAPCGYHSLDAEGTIIRINDTELNWLGYTRDEILHKKFLDFLTFESQQVFQDNFPKFKQQGWINNLEFEIITKDHTTRWISLNATAIKDEAGNFVMSRSTLFDISDRKRAEATLRQYERIVSSTKDGIALLNRNYIYQIVNQAYLDWCNKRDTEVLGYSVRDILGQELFESFIQPRLDRCLAGEIIQYERWFDYPNLVPQFLSVTYTPYREPDTTISGVIVSLRDLTRLKQAEQALHESEEKFRQLAENIQAVFWMTEIQSRQVLYVSPAYEDIWQSSCESLYHNFSDWLDAIHPDDRQRVEMALVEQVKTGKYDMQYRIIRPDGSIRWIRDRAFPIKNEAGELVRVAGIAEDITEQQKIEQMKSEFIGIVSHELRTPLTAIRAAMGLLNTGIYNNKPDKFKRMIEIALIDSDRLVRLVNDILDLERLESGRAVLEKTTCKAADLMQQAVEGVQAIANQQHITFDIHPTDAKVWAAADTIIQTLTNLLSNALKFSPADSTITLSVQQQTDCVLFQISDQGRGIPAEKLEAIFGRFQQIDASDSRDKGGTGLGLAICRSIIDQHGGQIWAESTLGVGSTFFFTLPLAGK